jgi:3-hydroxyisobutyrate dehydrogenase
MSGFRICERLGEEKEGKRMKAGFIGLGALGQAMAQRLIEQGVELVVWNRTIAKASDLNASVATSPRDVIAQVPVVFVNVRDSDAVQAVLSGSDGLLSGDCQGKIIIDTTTNHFGAVAAFHARVAERGGAYLEAPVAGSVIPASKGALTVLVGGDQATFDQARPYLEKIGSTIIYLETVGLATKMKLINNMVLGSFMATLAEAVAFGEAVGLDKAQVLDFLAAGAGNSGVLTAKRQKLLDEDFSPHFSASLVYKDLHYMQDLARTLGRPDFMGSLAKELYALATLDGLQDQDLSVIYAVLKGHRGTARP